jgi:hypothetical protein
MAQLYIFEYGCPQHCRSAAKPKLDLPLWCPAHAYGVVKKQRVRNEQKIKDQTQRNVGLKLLTYQKLVLLSKHSGRTLKGELDFLVSSAYENQILEN